MEKKNVSESRESERGTSEKETISRNTKMHGTGVGVVTRGREKQGPRRKMREGRENVSVEGEREGAGEQVVEPL